MKNLTNARFSLSTCRRGFTLIEVMVAGFIGCILAVGVIELLLQAEITSCLRSSSATQGLQPIWSSAVDYPGTTNVMGYTSVDVFAPNGSGGWITGQITFNPTNGLVLYTTNTLVPATQIVWMTNSATMLLTNLVFSPSQTLVGAEYYSLVNVQFQMNDNGYSNQNPTNNIACVFRNFSVQMRNDF
jgi:prepilin-type N-terminal cleavage/methylation domain-containing protein